MTTKPKKAGYIVAQSGKTKVIKDRIIKEISKEG